MVINQENTLTVDHFIPLTAGGRNEWPNYRAACHRCNNVKADMLPGEFYEFILQFLDEKG